MEGEGRKVLQNGIQPCNATQYHKPEDLNLSFTHSSIACLI